VVHKFNVLGLRECYRLLLIPDSEAIVWIHVFSPRPPCTSAPVEMIFSRGAFLCGVIGRQWVTECYVTWCCPPCGRGTAASIVSCRCTYCCLETSHGKITRHYLRYCTMAFCIVYKCELSYMCPGHDIKLHPHRVKLYRIGCVGSGLVLAEALT